MSCSNIYIPYNKKWNPKRVNLKQSWRLKLLYKGKSIICEIFHIHNLHLHCLVIQILCALIIQQLSGRKFYLWTKAIQAQGAESYQLSQGNLSIGHIVFNRDIDKAKSSEEKQTLNSQSLRPPMEDYVFPHQTRLLAQEMFILGLHSLPMELLFL